MPEHPAIRNSPAYPPGHGKLHWIPKLYLRLEVFAPGSSPRGLLLKIEFHAARVGTVGVGVARHKLGRPLLFPRQLLCLGLRLYIQYTKYGGTLFL